MVSDIKALSNRFDLDSLESHKFKSRVKMEAFTLFFCKIMKNIKSIELELNEFLHGKISKNKNSILPLSISDLISLKKILSDVNGLITKYATLELINEIYNKGLISETVRTNTITTIEDTSAFENGYDIFIEETGILSLPYSIAAEIKCNIPVGVRRFGATQQKGILKDIQNLFNPTFKKIATHKLGKPFFKIMGLLITEKPENFDEAVKDIMEKSKKNGFCCDYLPTNVLDLKSDLVYIVILKPQKIVKNIE